MYFNLHSRDIINDVTSAPQTFSSWDKCMTKTYCKWPAIVGIVIGGLVAITVVYCLARCLCCGAECCACCFRCCGRRRSGGQPSRYNDNSYSQMPPTPYSGYQPAPAAMNYQQPQFATFDASSKNKINEDSLPAMPSWDTATKRRVEDVSEQQPVHNQTEDVEMGHLGPQPQQQLRPTRGGYNQVPTGPISPALSQYNQGHDYMDASNAHHAYTSDLGAQRIPNYNTGHNDNFEDVPHSPAPTYQTHAPMGSQTNPDHFIAGAASPSPNEYNHRTQQWDQRSYAPSSTTGYEMTDHAPSSINTYQQQPRQGINRPPSFGYGNQTSPTGQRAPNFSYNHHPQTSPTEYSPSNYGYNQQTSPTNQKPPTLLQAGRRPGDGFVREI